MKKFHPKNEKDRVGFWWEALLAAVRHMAFSRLAPPLGCPLGKIYAKNFSVLRGYFYRNTVL
jgi:hypothetical protein